MFKNSTIIQNIERCNYKNNNELPILLFWFNYSIHYKLSKNSKLMLSFKFLTTQILINIINSSHKIDSGVQLVVFDSFNTNC